jgi:hypothetical protein
MKRLAPKLILLILGLSLAVVGTNLLGNTPVHAYSNSNMIDDSVFDNSNSMSAQQIQTFLNQFPNSCIKNYQSPDPQSWYNYGGMVSAAQVIKDAATMWGINPQVLLTTMEKEEGLVRGDGAYGCSNTSFWSAMGYNCPGSATYNYSAAQLSAAPDNYSGGLPANMSGGAGPTCAASPTNVGFSAQVSHGAWQLEFGRQRSEGNGNLGWDGDNTTTYYGYMTAGSRARVQGGSVSSYSGVITLNDNTTLTVANGATASLYSYTPYIQSFDTIFEGFFGSGSTSAHAYSATYYSQSSWPTIAPGNTGTGWIEYSNTGASTWYDDSSIGTAATGTYPVHLATAEPINRTSPFGATWGANANRPTFTFAAVYNSDGTTLATNQHVTQPGQIAKFSFTFTVSATQAPGVYQENFQPVAEGSPTGSFADPGTYLDVTVPAVYSSAASSQSANPTIKPGTSGTSTIAYKNTGNTSWYDDVTVGSSPNGYPTHLVTSNPINRSSTFGANWGSNHNRPANVFSAVYLADGTTLAPNQHVVAPGQIGQYTITFSAPNQQAANTYTEGFMPAQDGTSDGAMNDPGTAFTITVPSSSTGASTNAAVTSGAMTPGATQAYTASFTNTGNTTWTPSTTKLVGNSSTQYQSFQASGWTSSTIITALNESSVAPGAVGTFTFNITAPNAGGTYYLELAPSSDGNYASSGPAKYSFTVSPPIYSAQYAGQSSYPTLFPGQTATGYVEYKNTGNIPWYDDTTIGSAPAGSYSVHLATAEPVNRNSLFGATWGASHNRPNFTFSTVYQSDGTTLASGQDTVQPGQIAKYSFIFTAPSNIGAGVYQENFQPVAEGTSNGAFADPGTYLDVVVQQPNYSATYAGQSTYPSLSAGSTASGYVEYKNTGNISWYDDSSIGGAPAGSYATHLSTAQPVNRRSVFGATWGANANRPDFNFTAVYLGDGVTPAGNQHVVAPGQIVKFDFTFTASNGQVAGVYREYFQPVAEGTPTGAFGDPGTYLDVTVH